MSAFWDQVEATIQERVREEVSSAVNKAARNAREALGSIGEFRNLSQDGQKAINDAAESMRDKLTERKLKLAAERLAILATPED